MFNRSTVYLTQGIATRTLVLLERKTGIVKTWRDDRRYGFITDGTPGSDIFVHFRDLECADMTRKMLSVGEEVEFDVEEEASGKRKALRVTGAGGVPLKGGNLERTEDTVKVQEERSKSRFDHRPAESNDSHGKINDTTSESNTPDGDSLITRVLKEVYSKVKKSFT
mmetsp:Transcript_17630/g.27601  ORF Transcript_17630/g.27601 Transcript_17630/m.27601 type:complete len:167 (-) Transcript_17630:71-571(-)